MQPARFLRETVFIGQPVNLEDILSESIRYYRRTAEFLTRKKTLLRADLIVVNSENGGSDLAKALFESVHEAGRVLLKKSNLSMHSQLISHGFVRAGSDGFYQKKEKSVPKEYSSEYLQHFGEVDFLKNWQLAGRQILDHLPQGVSAGKARILDVGCLNGYTMEILRLSGVREVYGTDISYDLAVKNCINSYHLPAVTIGDFCQNNYPDKYFDLTLAFEVLEHIPPENTEVFLNELKRVTKDSGNILITSSDDPTVDPTHVNCRKPDEWYQVFLDNGLIPGGRQEIYSGFNSFVLRKRGLEPLIYGRFILSGHRLLRRLAKIKVLAVFRYFIERVKLIISVLAKSLQPDNRRRQYTDFNKMNRDRWIKEKAAGLPAGTSVLDVGAGECQYRENFRHCLYKTHDFGRYHGTDNSLVKETWKYGRIDYVSDINHIPVKEASFDVILCTEVLEHVPEPIKAIREFSRILKPGGRLFISTPFSSGMHQEPYNYYAGFSPYFYRRFLTDYGFAVRRIIANGGFFLFLMQEMSRGWQYLAIKNRWLKWLPHQLLGHFLVNKFLPAYLFRIDSETNIDKFTVGYFVEAEKL